MAATIDIGTLIFKDPQMHGGRPCITGTGTTVLAVWDLYRQGFTAEAITQQLPLSLEAVFAALSYVVANRAEIEGYYREDDALHHDWFGAR